MERKQFTWYRSYYDALKEIPAEEFRSIVLAVCAYALDGEEAELSGVARAIFTLIRPTLEVGRSKAENRSRAEQTPLSAEQSGNRPEQTKNKPEQTQNKRKQRLHLHRLPDGLQSIRPQTPRRRLGVLTVRPAWGDEGPPRSGVFQDLLAILLRHRRKSDGHDHFHFLPPLLHISRPRPRTADTASIPRRSIG